MFRQLQDGCSCSRLQNGLERAERGRATRRKQEIPRNIRKRTPTTSEPSWAARVLQDADISPHSVRSISDSILFRLGNRPDSLRQQSTGQNERAEDADDLSDDFSIGVIAKLFGADESSSVGVEHDELVFDCATAERV